MSHCIEGFIGKIDHLKKSNLKVIPCPKDNSMGFIPITDEIYDALVQHEQHCPTCGHAYDPLETFGKTLEPVALIKTDYFGGAGEQSAVLWIDGGCERLDSIDDALKKLGVIAKGGMDEFDTIGLGKHRSNDSWLGKE